MTALGAAKCLLSWPNYALPALSPRTDAVTQILTPVYDGVPGAYQATMPLANMADEKLYKATRSTSLANTFFNVDFGVARPIRLVALMRHNFSALVSGAANAPTIRVTVGNDASFATFAKQTAFVPVFSAAVTAPGSLPAGWDAGPSMESLLPYASLCAVIDLGANYSGRYMNINIQDPANGNGYVQWGGLHAGPGYQPTINMAYSPKLYGDDKSTSSDGDTGVEFWYQRPIARVAEFALDALHTDEALELPFELGMRSGIARSLFFCMDPASPYHMHRLSFPARLVQLDGIAYPYYDTMTAPFKLREVL